jgi:hypothetical protein
MKVVQDVDTSGTLGQFDDVTPAVYDPAKKYSWGVEGQFVMNGQEFGLILNTLRAVVSTEEAVKILLADKACQVMESLMSKGVSEGSIVEVV